MPNSSPPKPAPRNAAACSAGAVHDDDGIIDVPVGAACRLAERGVMQAQFRQFLAGFETEIAGDPIAFHLAPGYGTTAAHSEQNPDDTIRLELTWTNHTGELITGLPHLVVRCDS